MTNTIPYGSSVRSVDDVLPVGALISWHSATPPKNFLLCNGQEVDPAVYPRLAALISTTFGTGGTGKGKLPDLSGRLVLNPTSNADVGVVAGTDTHTHTFNSNVNAFYFNYVDGSHSHNHTSANFKSSGDHSHGGGGSGNNDTFTTLKRATGGSTVRSFETHSHSIALGSSSVSHGHSLYVPSGANWTSTDAHGHTSGAITQGVTVNTAAQAHLPRNLQLHYVVYAGGTP